MADLRSTALLKSSSVFDFSLFLCARGIHGHECRIKLLALSHPGRSHSFLPLNGHPSQAKSSICACEATRWAGSIVPIFEHVTGVFDQVFSGNGANRGANGEGQGLNRVNETEVKVTVVGDQQHSRQCVSINHIRIRSKILNVLSELLEPALQFVTSLHQTRFVVDDMRRHEDDELATRMSIATAAEQRA